MYLDYLGARQLLDAALSWRPLSDRCSGRIRDRAGGKYAVSVDRANETGRQTGTLDCPEGRKIWNTLPGQSIDTLKQDGVKL